MLILQDKKYFKISKQHIIQIVEKASTLAERLSNQLTFHESQANDTQIETRLEKWCQVVAKGDRQKFEKRLGWDGLNINSVRRVLSNVCLINEQYLPDWAETLWEGMEAAFAFLDSDQSNLKQHCCLVPQKPLPFEEALLPFVDVAKKKLLARIGSNYQLLSAEAQSQLERKLLERLVTLCAYPLELEFSIFRSLNTTSLFRLLGQIQSGSSQQQYTQFIHKLLEDGLLSFFREYSVLARLVATAMNFWVDATSEFILRLASDWNKIQSTFQGNTELGQVITVKLGLSDPHNCGRSVIILEFTSGLKLVYKPKDLGLEQAYFELLAWINQQEVCLPLKLLKVINCSSYGWMEFAEALPCENQEGVKRYYQRAGIILCIVYALGGNDCHCENLIVCGEQPVLVDLETLLHHRIWTAQEDAGAYSRAREWLQSSVISTALLPGWQQLHGQAAKLGLDISGLGGSSGEEISYRTLKWQHTNTDSMMLQYEDVKMQPKQNQPFGEGIDASLNHYGEELVNGFRQMYQFLMQRQESLLTIGSPIAAFACQKVRLVFRNTNLYFSVLYNTLQPKYLRNGLDFSIELDILSRGFLNSEEKHPFWSILTAEKQSLEQLDIPYFTAYSDSDELKLPSHQVIQRFVNQSSYQDVIIRLQQLNNRDLTRQISVIKAALYSCMKSENLNSLPSKKIPSFTNKVAPLTSEVMVQQALAIAQEIQQQAIYDNDGSAAWLGMVYIPEIQKFQLQPLSYSLSNGCSGISLFLSALATVTGKTEFSDLALASLHPLRKALRESNVNFQQKLIKHMGFAGAKGIASTVYALVCIAKFLDKAQLLQDAQQLASWITLDKNAANLAPGIMNGIAGTILGLLALYRATQEPTILEQAITWGKHLLNTRVALETGDRAWTTPDNKLLTGYSHGIAGIAYALLQLYAASKNSLFLSAAREAIASEQSFFSDANLFLEDSAVTVDNGIVSGTSWCHDVAGIALARLGGLAILDTDAIRQELEMTMRSIYPQGLQEVDNLCSGNFSRIEVLLVASEKLSNPEFLRMSHEQTAQILTRANQIGSFELLANLPPEVDNPGLCHGKAGIGYELLRLACPNLLPSVLLWQ
ncbi:type 2 lantipeptide synthetase LanM [Scytonema sp. UIC 10036]|uniref:type 2 lanthipeptide synthetase LanM family protein n=1 Tax=Scytonema sp. UIC 10036 TaxID=2304196 RepID=UPI0012DAC8B2|nr:type 2 lanthipeptide synthetase LanM family protein [Scytonema sp. UIC 10036]MUG97843.1 type 2 lantipeptide synthetase LanM [Scytonema sp. UIC 10036]